MKRILLGVCCLILFVSCVPKNGDPSSKKTIIATVMTESNILYDEESIGLFTMNYDKPFEVGDVLEIEFSGMVAESYPAQIGKPYKVMLLKHDENKILLMMKILDETIALQSDVIKSVKEISLDLVGLSPKELNVVHYLMMNRYENVEVVLASYDELIKQGKIDTKTGYFRGLNLQVKLEEKVTKDSFVFKSSLRSGLELIVFADGSAEKSNGNYQVIITLTGIS